MSAAAGAGRKLIVFGGTGFVGSHVARIAVEQGFNVLVASRGGEPVGPKEEWHDKAIFIGIDALVRNDVYAFLDEHPDTHSVVSCIGKLTLNKPMARRINGDPTCNIAAAAYERKAISKVTFISAAKIKPAHLLLDAYYYGKAQAEMALTDHLPGRHSVLRPGFIHGTRNVAGFPVPLSAIGAPLEMMFAPFHAATGLSLLTPPVSVDNVAKAAVQCSIEPSREVGVFEYADIMRLAKRV